MSRNGSVPRLHTNALGMVRKNLLIAEKSREKLPKERAKSDQPGNCKRRKWKWKRKRKWKRKWKRVVKITSYEVVGVKFFS